jgi:hypothetical protein
VKHSLQALTPAGVRVLDPEPKIGAHGNPVGCAACWTNSHVQASVMRNAATYCRLGTVSFAPWA